jgi:hypothetical protein
MIRNRLVADALPHNHALAKTIDVTPDHDSARGLFGINFAIAWACIGGIGRSSSGSSDGCSCSETDCSRGIASFRGLTWHGGEKREAGAKRDDDNCSSEFFHLTIQVFRAVGPDGL